MPLQVSHLELSDLVYELSCYIKRFATNLMTSPSGGSDVNQAKNHISFIRNQLQLDQIILSLILSGIAIQGCQMKK